MIINQVPPGCQELELRGPIFTVAPGNRYYYYPYFQMRQLRLRDDV